MSARRPIATLAAAACAAAFLCPTRVSAQGLFENLITGPQPTVTDTEEARRADGVDLGEGVPLGEWLGRKAEPTPADATPAEPPPLAAPRSQDVPRPDAPSDLGPSLTDLDAYPLLPADDFAMPRRGDPTPTLRRPSSGDRPDNDLPDWAAPIDRRSNKPAADEFDDLLMDEDEPAEDARPSREGLSAPLLVQPRGRDYFPKPIPTDPPALPTPEETGPEVEELSPPSRVRTLRPRAADAGTPEGVRLAIGGELLDNLFRNEQQRCGDVNDCVLGAQVRGRQRTRTRTSLRLRPCETAAQFDVVLSGRTLSETSGSTSVAAVQSTGDHTFEMVKPFRFDGDTIQTATPAATVWPRQTNVAATPLRGRVPIVGRVVGRLAYEEAQRRKPATERIAAGRLTDRVAGQFNGSIDAVLLRLQSVWDDRMLARLERAIPDAKRPTARTTDTHAVFKLPTPNAVEAAGDLPAGWPAGGDGVSLAVHDSAVVAALGRLSLAGRELPRGDWGGLVDRLLPNARVAKKPAGGEDLSSLGTLRLADADPIDVRFRGGRAEVILRGVIVTPLGETAVQRITIPWTVSADGDSVYLQPGQPSVAADEPDAAGDVDAALMDRVRDLVEMTVAEEMRTVRLRRSVELPVSDRSMRMTLADLRLRDGWLVLGWDAELR